MAYKNPEDQRAAACRHYEANKDLMKSRAAESKKAYMARNRAYVSDYLSNNPCVDCGNDDIRVLEFDHVRGVKINNVSNMVRNATGLTKLSEEIDKCEVRCANCHRIKTHETLWNPCGIV